MLPCTGLLQPGQACQIKVTFQPLMAIIYEVQATCWYGEGSKQKSSIQLQAAGEAQPLTCPQSPPAALPWVLKPPCAPLTPPSAWPGPHGTSTRFLPIPSLAGFAFLDVIDQCFSGFTYLL